MIHICIYTLQLNRTHSRTGIFFFSRVCSLIRAMYMCPVRTPFDPVAVSFDFFPYFVVVVAVVAVIIVIVNVVDDFSLSSQRQNINQKKEFCTHKYIMEPTLPYEKSSPLFEIKLSVRCFVRCYSCCLFLVLPLRAIHTYTFDPNEVEKRKKK